MRLSIALFVALVLCSASIRSAEPAPSPQALEFFEKHVRPLLVAKCQSCHGPKRQQGGLRLDSRAALLKGGENGPIVSIRAPERSRLLHVLSYDGDVQMPPKGKLPQQDIDRMAEWIKQGAPWPESIGSANERKRTPTEVRLKHWAFQPVKKPALPTVKNPTWVKAPVDAFVLARLEERGVTPAPEADRRTLLRRLMLDLHGLPPTPEETTAFEADRSPDAYEKLVDRLLASPRYGERWGRHWLDVSRYADSKGYVFQEERRYPFAYTYRDYVIRAFNDDLPYDQFIVQQLAADRLPWGDDNRPLAALGFLTLGRRFLNNVPDIIDDRIDVTMRGFQAMTVGCARCHDHKFDPIPTRDYYSLYGVFDSSIEPKDLPLLDKAEANPGRAEFDKELAKRQGAVEGFQKKNQAELAKNNRKIKDQLRDLRNKVDQWQATSPNAPPRAMVLQDRPQPHAPHVFLRGNPSNPGPSVPRQFLEVVATQPRRPFVQGSGRLELARAIADKDNPLTARVMVNRTWLHHFGAGLVRTPSDFGLRGEAPTHPELLDWLAASFVEQGWSVKKLHRLVLLSNTYRQACRDDAELARLDPDNRWLARSNRRRREFEALRDSLLAVAGRLDVTMGGRAVELTSAPFTTRRTLYGFIDRQNLPGLFRTFDFASPDATSPQRFETTVPQQALFLMNSPFVIEQARHFLARPDVANLPTNEEKIQRMYRLAFSRAADKDELSVGLRFLAEAKSEQKTAQPLSAWEQYAQVLLLSNEFAFVD